MVDTTSHGEGSNLHTTLPSTHRPPAAAELSERPPLMEEREAATIMPVSHYQPERSPHPISYI